MEGGGFSLARNLHICTYVHIYICILYTYMSIYIYTHVCIYERIHPFTEVCFISMVIRKAEGRTSRRQPRCSIMPQRLMSTSPVTWKRQIPKHVLHQSRMNREMASAIAACCVVWGHPRSWGTSPFLNQSEKNCINGICTCTELLDSSGKHCRDIHS